MQIRSLFSNAGTYPRGLERVRGGSGKAYEDHRLFIGDVSGGKFRDNSLLVQVEAPAKGERGGGDRKSYDGAHD
jgi:hypothetical protein